MIFLIIDDFGETIEGYCESKEKALIIAKKHNYCTGSYTHVMEVGELDTYKLPEILYVTASRTKHGMGIFTMVYKDGFDTKPYENNEVYEHEADDFISVNFTIKTKEDETRTNLIKRCKLRAGWLLKRYKDNKEKEKKK